MKKLMLSLTTLLVACTVTAQTVNSKKVKQLITEMTLEEKVKLVVGMGMKLPGVNISTGGPVVGETQDKVPGAAGTTYAIPRLGIPTVVVADGPAGLRIQPVRDGNTAQTYYCTAFPVGTLLASTWDTVLVQRVGSAMGNEVKAYGVDILLAPALNIQRNPLGGRNFEYYSEDPVVSGNIAAAMVKGIESNGVGTSIKHFAANNQETNRNLVNTIVSERALREIYLKGFEIAVKKSQPQTVMSSYNKINGTYTSQDADLLTTILRKEWGFKGLVMTDWFGGTDPVEQMKAGNDLLMPGTPALVDAILKAINNGSLDSKIVEANAARILEIILETPSYKKTVFNNKPDLKANAIVAREAASEGMVLLKNNNEALPFKKSIRHIAAFGNTSYDFISGGTGSGDVNEAYTVSLVEGLSNAGYIVDKELQVNYEKFLVAEKAKQPAKKFFFELPAPLPEMMPGQKLLEEKALSADIGIITIGRNAGEFQDRKQANDYYLGDAEKQLIKRVAAAFHQQKKQVVVILNVGGVVDVTAWRDDVDAILLAWQAGQESGNAVAGILSGKINPSGKLAVSFPMSYDDDPSSKNFPGKNLSAEPQKGVGGFSLGYDSEVMYEEGIYVGYRYYNTFNIKPAYSFGYGLSYTKFDYGAVTMSKPGPNAMVTVTLDITNAGTVAGKEVVQLYITAPRGQLAKPSEELKAFAKTELLAPGKKQQITFSITARDLTSFDTNTTSWLADAGVYTIKIAGAANDIRRSATFELPSAIVVEKCNKVMVPQVAIKELQQ